MRPKIREQMVGAEFLVQQTCQVDGGLVPSGALYLCDARAHDVNAPSQFGLRQSRTQTQTAQARSEQCCHR